MIGGGVEVVGHGVSSSLGVSSPEKVASGRGLRQGLVGLAGALGHLDSLGGVGVPTEANRVPKVSGRRRSRSTTPRYESVKCPTNKYACTSSPSSWVSKASACGPRPVRIVASTRRASGSYEKTRRDR